MFHPDLYIPLGDCFFLFLLYNDNKGHGETEWWRGSSTWEFLRQADKGQFCQGEKECWVKAPAVKIHCVANRVSCVYFSSVAAELQYMQAGTAAHASERELSFPTAGGSGELSAHTSAEPCLTQAWPIIIFLLSTSSSTTHPYNNYSSILGFNPHLWNERVILYLFQDLLWLCHSVILGVQDLIMNQYQDKEQFFPTDPWLLGSSPLGVRLLLFWCFELNCSLWSFLLLCLHTSFSTDHLFTLCIS